jgi:hypothetical protein
MRPITTPLADGDRFVVDEQQELHPGMSRVVGPFDPASGALVDFFTDGNPVRYRAECRSTIEQTFGRAVPFGQPPVLSLASPTTSGAIRGRATQVVVLPCHWYHRLRSERGPRRHRPFPRVGVTIDSPQPRYRWRSTLNARRYRMAQN